MVGSALYRLMPDAFTWGRREDLRSQEVAHNTLSQIPNCDVLYLCAACVGGIGRNISEPGAMLYDNLMIQANVIEAARLAGVKLIVFFGSSCIYPAVTFTPKGPFQGPWTEKHLMTGPLEPTNAPYAMAKLAGIEMLRAYRAQYGLEYLVVIPCNLYGPNDNFRPRESHLMASLIQRFHAAADVDAEAVVLWGTGTPRREMLHVDDLALAIRLLVKRGARGIVNVGAGFDATVSEWADIVAAHSNWNGEIVFDGDESRDGVASKLMRTEPIPGWQPRKAGVREAVEWYAYNRETARR